MVEELAQATGNVDMVRLHLDDQMDSKSLLGAYVCTSNPEEFVWQPGPLTQVGFCPSAVHNRPQHHLAHHLWQFLLVFAAL